MKKLMLLLFALFTVSVMFGQLDPVKWTYEAKKVGEGEYELVFKAHIEPGWYVYSQFLESDEGPIRTSFKFDKTTNIELLGDTNENGQKHEGFDDLFAMNVIKFSGEPVFTQKVKVKSSGAISGYLEYMTCDNERCLPPKEVPFEFALK